MQPQMQQFGISEVYAYLAVWIKHADDCLDRGSHVKYMPQPREIAEYVAARGWL